MNLFKRMLNSNEPWFIMVIELSGVQFGLKSQVWLNKPWNLIGCFVFRVAWSLAGKKMQFKAKNGAVRE